MWFNSILTTIAVGALLLLATSNNFNDFVLFKKTHGFRMDFNKALDQLRFSKPIQVADPVTVQNLEDKINRVSELATKVSNVSVEVTATAAHTNFWLTGLSIFLGCALFYTLIRYNVLQKKFNKVVNLSKGLVSDQKERIALVKNSRITALDLKEKHEAAVARVRESTQKMKKASFIDLRQNKLSVETFVDKFVKTAVLSTTRYFDRNLEKSTKLFQANQKTTILTALNDLHHKFIKSRTFENCKNLPPYIIYASLSLVIIYAFLEMGFNSESANDFISSINSQSFFSYGEYATTFHIKDLENSINTGIYDQQMNVQSNTASVEKVWEVFEKRTHKNLKKII